LSLNKFCFEPAKNNYLSKFINMENSNVLNFNVVDKIVQIAKKLENSKMDEEVIEELKLPLQVLSEYLNVTIPQAIVFSIIFVLEIKIYNIDLRDIFNFLDLSFLDSLNLKSNIDKLIEKNLIEIEQESGRKTKKTSFIKLIFSIQSDVSLSIYENKPIVKKDIELLDIYSFLKNISSYIEQRERENIETTELFEMIKKFENSNEHIEPILKVKKILDIEDRTLLYEIINNHIIGFSTSMEKTLRQINQNARKRILKMNELVEKTNIMYELDLITLGESRFANDFSLSLTNKSIELFMQNDASLFIKDKKVKNLILNENISYKELFYEPNVSKEVNFLTDSLINEKFISLQERLANISLSKGVASIFYGAPGTGKTETVYQIAKATGRDILLVDISQSKSMWFGESEKRIKDIFNSYRKACNSMEIKPILFFNEADALLNKRQENSQSNVGQTENAIQNILLEEMEKFEGIMIATTNLEGNLDAAYERRFLFKIKFESPTVDVKVKIWQNKLSWLNNNFIGKLANDFSFSGGEIDNIVRKITIQEVLTGKRPESNEIYDFCKNEKVLSNNKGKFVVGYE